MIQSHETIVSYFFLFKKIVKTLHNIFKRIVACIYYNNDNTLIKQTLRYVIYYYIGR